MQVYDILKSVTNPKTKFYIFRHGETFVTTGKALSYGTKVFSADILPFCFPTLEKLGQQLKNIKTDYNISSKIKRCRQTVGIVAKQADKEFEFDSRLNEFFFELPFFFKRRIRNFLKEIENRNFESVAICTHGAVINELIKQINPEAFLTLINKSPDPSPPLQTEASRKSLQLENKLTFTKYLAPGVLLTLTSSSVKEINFNDS